MAARALVAFANRLRVGVLQDENGTWSFIYDVQWLATRQQSTRMQAKRDSSIPSWRCRWTK
ncbi:hypothetical protein E4O92_22025 [Massilia horti]|uniref:HipA N-terminal subdomain 1 domain-containing protein n=1 Tax=Massilia horti TaxID=2562153 RepID=A0A4Y9SP86_9BURK|nr:hypothetical protein E4O92_22025 [Massilia horti]